MRRLLRRTIGMAVCLAAGTAVRAAPAPIKALLVTGGAAHDYDAQKTLLAEAASARAHESSIKAARPATPIWTNRCGTTRVFGTSPGHANSTFQMPVYQELLARGILWACDKLDENGAPKPGYGPGGGEPGGRERGQNGSIPRKEPT